MLPPAGKVMRLCFMGDFESIHLRRWIKHFIERGHQVSLLSYSGESVQMEGLEIHSLLENSSGETQRLPSKSPPSRTREWAHRHLPLGLLTAKMSLKWLRHGIRKKLEEIQPDILHGHFLVEHGLYAAVTGFSPLVVSAWGSDLLLHPQRSLMNRWLVSYTVKRSSLVHLASPFMLTELEKMGLRHDNIVIANLGVGEDLLDVQTQSTADSSVLVSTRKLGQVYNPATIIRAVKLVSKIHPQVLLKLVGKGPLSKDLQILVDQLSLQANVQLPGPLPSKDVVQILSEADLYLSTSLSDSASIALLEAMAVGLFPIVSDIAGNREWITDGVNGFLVDPHDPDALAARITLALRRVDWRREVGQQNKEIVKRRALRRNQMDIVEEAYRELVSRQ